MRTGFPALPLFRHVEHIPGDTGGGPRHRRQVPNSRATKSLYAHFAWHFLVVSPATVVVCGFTLGCPNVSWGAVASRISQELRRQRCKYTMTYQEYTMFTILYTFYQLQYHKNRFVFTSSAISCQAAALFTDSRCNLQTCHVTSLHATRICSVFQDDFKKP